MTDLYQPRFVDYTLASKVADQFGTPVYLYDRATLEASASAALAFPNAFGLTVRYAMKAAPNAAILQLFARMGLSFDASSGHEVHRAIAAGVDPKSISLSAQELPSDFAALLETGTAFNACSLNQLEAYGRLRPGTRVGVRFNPGAGSGGNNRTNVGGPSSSFGIWHEYRDKVQAIAEMYALRIDRIHSHIGSGSDPEVWLRVVELNLDLVRAFPKVTTLNLGGGFKVGRMADEVSTDLQVVGAPVRQSFINFAQETGRELHLEIEPGTYLVANAGALLARVQDCVATGENGYQFVKLDAGMTDLLRPSIYGAQHPIAILQSKGSQSTREYVVVGHCCESGDILTPAPGDPELLAPRTLAETSIGDFCVIDGAGAYASSMATKHYNSYPECAEVIIDRGGDAYLIRKRQVREEIWANEVSVELS